MLYLTENEYIESRKTVLDSILFYSWVPAILVFFLLSLGLLVDPEYRLQRELTFIFILTFMLTIICRTWLGKRVTQYKLDYQEYLRKLNTQI